MKSASYEYRKMSARRGAQFVSIGMPTNLSPEELYSEKTGLRRNLIHDNTEQNDAIKPMYDYY